jgi:signal transduction histidine kinase
VTEGPAVEAPTLEALRQTRESWAARRRRLRPIGLAGLAIFTYIIAAKPPHVGLHGQSLGLTIALAGQVIGLLGARRTLVVRPMTWQWYVPFLVLLLVSSSFLVWLQPDGPAVIGFLGALVMVQLGRVIPSRLGTVLLFAICLAMLVTAVLTSGEHDHSRWLGIVVSVLPLIAFFFAASLFAWNRRVAEQTEDLLVRLEETRGAELRAAALAERQRLARDMHDVLAHTLSGLTLQLEGARLMAQVAGDSRVAGAVERAHELAKNGLAEARQAISMLRGDELPGPEHLGALADAFAADTGVPCRFAMSGTAVEIRPEVKLALYRVTQEALTNTRKHAHPDRVSVTLTYEGGDVDLVIQDFGVASVVPAGHSADHGADHGADYGQGGYGLAGMRERAELLGGTLTAGPTDDGFRVELRVAA